MWFSPKVFQLRVCGAHLWRPPLKLRYSNWISVFDPKRTRCTKKKKEVKDNAGNSPRVFSLELAEVFAYVRFKVGTGDARVMFA